jgi:predicted homoserine dehydrogenase-like protein
VPAVLLSATLLDLQVFLSCGDAMNIHKVGVLGAGTMGNGIAHVFARAGYEVLLCDVEQAVLDRALATISKNMDREVAKGMGTGGGGGHGEIRN